jgi:transposase
MPNDTLWRRLYIARTLLTAVEDMVERNKEATILIDEIESIIGDLIVETYPRLERGRELLAEEEAA